MLKHYKWYILTSIASLFHLIMVSVYQYQWYWPWQILAFVLQCDLLTEITDCYWKGLLACFAWWSMIIYDDILLNIEISHPSNCCTDRCGQNPRWRSIFYHITTVSGTTPQWLQLLKINNIYKRVHSYGSILELRNWFHNLFTGMIQLYTVITVVMADSKNCWQILWFPWNSSRASSFLFEFKKEVIDFMQDVLFLNLKCKCLIENQFSKNMII